MDALICTPLSFLLLLLVTQQLPQPLAFRVYPQRRPTGLVRVRPRDSAVRLRTVPHPWFWLPKEWNTKPRRAKRFFSMLAPPDRLRPMDPSRFFLKTTTPAPAAPLRSFAYLASNMDRISYYEGDTQNQKMDSRALRVTKLKKFLNPKQLVADKGHFYPLRIFNYYSLP